MHNNDIRKQKKKKNIAKLWKEKTNRKPKKNKNKIE